MKTGWLAIVFAMLTTDVYRDGRVAALERRHCSSPPPASSLTHIVTELGGRKAAGTALLCASVAARGHGDSRVPGRAIRIVITIGGRFMLASVVRRRRPPRTWWQ